MLDDTRRSNKRRRRRRMPPRICSRRAPPTWSQARAINYSLKASRAAVSSEPEKGKVIRDVRSTGHAGVNHVAWIA
jgi:hypothetical protein